MQDAGQNNAVAPHGRAAERVKLHGRAHLSLGSDVEQPPLEVELEDLSLNGAGIISPVDLHTGTRVVLLLHPINHSPGSLRGHVLNSRSLDNNHFRIGMEFDLTDGPTIKCIRQAFYPDDALDV